jgi:uncharacterized protein (DUF2237 family)
MLLPGLLSLLVGGVLANLNVVGTSLSVCSLDPLTGWRRDGFCRHDADDGGAHLVCALMDDRFLAFTASRGNDLTRVVAAGSHWCLCAARWIEAARAGVAPQVKLEATHANSAALFGLSLEQLHSGVLKEEL